MKKIFSVVVCAAVIGWAGSAMALTFTMSDYDVTVSGSDPGLVIWEEAILGSNASWNLEVGQSVTFDLFKVGTGESAVNSDDIWPKDATVSFAFTAPGLDDGTVYGFTRGAYLTDRGYIAWLNPAIFNFGNGGLYSITLGSENFTTPGSDYVHATLKYDRASAPVPEPTTMLLFGTGLVGLAAVGRRKKA